MHLDCNREKLSAVLSAMAGIVPSKHAMPIYMNLKVKATDKDITFLGTDLEVSLRHVVDLGHGFEAKRQGEALWPIGKLSQIVRESSTDSIDIESDDRLHTVTSFTSTYEIQAESPAGFVDEVPAIADDETDGILTFRAGDIVTAIGRGHFACTKESGKYAMQGMFWLLKSDSACDVVSTDGKRIAVSELQCSGGSYDATKKLSANIPVKAMRMLKVFLDAVDPETPVKARLSYASATFQFSGTVLTTRTLEGIFPPYATVIPKKSSVELEINSSEFLRAIRQASIMVDAESKRLDMSFTTNRIMMKAQGANTGKSSVNFPVIYNQKEFTVSIDPSYMSELMRAVGDDQQLKFKLTDRKSSVVFQTKDGNYTHVIVPLIEAVST